LFIKSVVKLTVCLALASFFSLLSVAQQNPPPSTEAPAQNQPQEAAKTPEQAAQAQTEQTEKTDKDKKDDKRPSIDPLKGKIEGTSNDRLFYALPNFLTLENAGKLPPLTTKQKFGVVAESSLDPVAIPWYAFVAGLGQLNDSEPRYGQGAAGYGKRYVTTAADGLIENFMVGAVLPSLLHQDPRYFQNGHGGFFHRTWYAASRMIITRTDSGHEQFNYSEIVGGMLSAAISTYSYHPTGGFISKPTNPHYYVASDRTFDNTTSVWATQLGYDTITAVVKEFWPDIHRKISPKFRRETTGH
jgi:hypothetical protein